MNLVAKEKRYQHLEREAVMVINAMIRVLLDLAIEKEEL